MKGGEGDLRGEGRNGTYVDICNNYIQCLIEMLLKCALIN